MTPRERYNEELKAHIRQEAERQCAFIDEAEKHLKALEETNSRLANEIDRLMNRETER